MLINPTSNYPNQIDPMIFFQDVCLEKKDIMDHYNNLIAQNKYTEANQYISQQSGFFLYSADFFNLIENRIYALQSYLLTKQPKKYFVSSDEKPQDVKLNTIWI